MTESVACLSFAGPRGPIRVCSPPDTFLSGKRREKKQERKIVAAWREVSETIEGKGVKRKC
jgi:hypothetical protein